MNVKKEYKIFINAFSLIVLLSSYGLSFGQNIIVDFQKRSDPPLLKKFAQYNAGLPPMLNYERDIDLIDQVYSDNFRTDLGIGKAGTTGSNPDVVTGTPGNLSYDFSKLDKLAKMLNEHDVLPYYSWCYIPKPLQKNGDWRNLDESIPEWEKSWQEIYAQYSKHYKDDGIRIGYHEIYNEPDLFGVFLDQDDFNKRYNIMYKHGALGIRAGNPEAVVGGPAFAIGELANGFTSYVLNEQLPLDFFSFHTYFDGSSWPGELNVVRGALNNPYFNTTEIHLNECSWLNSDNGANLGAMSPFNFYGAAARIFDVFEEVLKKTDITWVNWAQFMESGFGDDPYGTIRKNGIKKAAYNAFKIYADLPVQRYDVTKPSDIGCFASYDDDKAGILIWNKTNLVRSIDLVIKNLPFDKGIIKVYKINKNNASYFDGGTEDLHVLNKLQNISLDNYLYSDVLVPNASLYLTIHKEEAEDFTPNAGNMKFARVKRQYHYYKSREKGNYAAYDRKKSIAYLGMANELSAWSQTAVEVDSILHPLHIKFDTDGNFIEYDKNSLLGLRVDFREEGIWTQSILFHGGLYNESRDAEMAWGTKREADQVIEVNDLGSFLIDLNEKAPSLWDGTAILTFIMQNTGVRTRAEVKIRSNMPDNVQIPQKKNSRITLNRNNNLIEVFTFGFEGEKKLKIFDILGRMIKRGEIFHGETHQFSTESFHPGTYLLNIESRNTGGTLKFIVQ